MSLNQKLKHGVSSKNIWIIVCSVMAVLVIIVGAIIIYNMYNSKSPVMGPNTADIDSNAQDYVDSLDSQPEGTGVAIPGWGIVNIPSGKTNVSLDLPNPDSNAGKYYLTFQLILVQGGKEEVLYTSKMVEPGKVIQNITLNRPLQEGKYNAIIRVQPYRMGSIKATNNADMATELRVY